MSQIGGQKKRFLVVWKILGSSSCWNTRNNQKRNPIALKRSSCCPTGGLKKTGRVQRRWLPEASAGGRSFMSFFLVQQEPTASCNKHTQKKTDSGQWEPPLTKKGSASSAQEERDRSLNRSPSLSFSSDQRNLFVWNFFLFHFFSLFFRRPQSRKTLHRIMCSIKCLFPFVAIFLPTLPGLCTLWVNFKVRTLKFRFFSDGCSARLPPIGYLLNIYIPLEDLTLDIF